MKYVIPVIAGMFIGTAATSLFTLEYRSLALDAITEAEKAQAIAKETLVIADTALNQRDDAKSALAKVTADLHACLVVPNQ